MTNQTALAPALAAKLDRQLDQWRKSLVAMDRRQRLLYFKHTKSSSFELVGSGADTIASKLHNGACVLFSRHPDEAPPSATAVARGIEVGSKMSAELERGLLRLDKGSRQAYADRGLWTLYLGLGMLQWVDADDGKSVVSPLVLLPVELTRSAKDQPFQLAPTEDDPVFNPALRLKLEELGLAVPDIDIDDVSVAGVLSSLRDIVSGRPGWSVLDRSILTTFSFHKEAMFRDLEDNHDAVAGHPLVQLLALGPDSPTADTLSFDPVDERSLDKTCPPEELVSILDADGSQRRCILAAKSGQSFVMDGPPGTGKSQTIANIIVELMAAGKTVLFVSEKAAALDVVRNRLDRAGLRNFLLELHSHAATRKHVVDDLYVSLSNQVKVNRPFSDSDRDILVKSRLELTGYATAMNEVRRPFGQSVFNVLGRITQLAAPVVTFMAPTRGVNQLTGQYVAEVLSHTKQLAAAWRPVIEGGEFLWAGLANVNPNASDSRRTIQGAADTARAAKALISRLKAVDEDLGLMFSYSEADGRRRTQLVHLAETNPGVPEAWLTARDLSQFHDRIKKTEQAVAELKGAKSILDETTGGRWRELDPVRLDAISLLKTAGWRPPGTATTTRFKGTLELLNAAPARLQSILNDAQRLAGLLGMPDTGLTASRAQVYTQLAGLGSTTTKPEASWLNPSMQNAVYESMQVLGPLVEVVRQREATMRTVFKENALELDLSAFNIRFRDAHKGLAKLGSQARQDKKQLKGVTVRGKVDKEVLTHLAEAAAWQEAYRELSTNEKQFAPALGTRYQRLDTDFVRIGSAVAVAHKAVQLAGADLDSTRLAAQLAVGSNPDPSLLPLSERLSVAIAAWIAEVQRVIDAPTAKHLLEMALDKALDWSVHRSTELTEPFSALEHVAIALRKDVTVDEARHTLSAVSKVDTVEKGITGSLTSDVELLGARYTGLSTDWNALKTAMSWAEQVREILAGALAPSVARNLVTLTLTSKDLNIRVVEWSRARDTLMGYFSKERSVELAADLAADLTLAEEVLTQMADTGPQDIDEWCQLERERRWLASEGFHPLLKEVEKEVKDPSLLPACFEQTILQSWVDDQVAKDPRLEKYRATDRDRLVEQFHDLDRRLVEQSNATVAMKCSARRPNSARSHSAQIIIRESAKKTRHKPIRLLLSETAALVQELKPCFMMSPLSVSQYLPPEWRFDTIIFDEASQVLPSDAVNCVYRGDQLIVAGDQKQLPPTDFFTSADDELDEDDDLDTFRSVLDLAKGAGGLTSLPLRWHYRSKHESLITYSNYRFYDGNLYTFPGAIFESPDLGVEFILCDGQYRRGGARDNPIEAAKVAERVAHHLHAHPELSMGVVTFSSAQEDAITLALNRLAEDNASLAALLADHDRLDGFFVKSLENVQGDERDIILFSIGYGPDEFGKLTMAFGPLNREGGWRRLNVAVTRARRRVEVVSSFRASQMSETGSEGVRHLRGYLDFAERGLASLSTDSIQSLGDAESVFEEQVLQVIRSWGYEVVSQVGAAGYRIDMAVKHPDRPGEFVLAIECDGAAYHSGKTARDRDRLREAVLVGLGWRVFRIWGIDWWRQRDAQLKRLRRAIDSAIAASVGGTAHVIPERRSAQNLVEFEAVDFEAPPGWAAPYRPAASGPLEPKDPKLPESAPVLRRYFEKVLAAEAPIHDSLLMVRFRRDWKVGQVGRVIRANLDAVLAKVQVDGHRVEKDAAGFYRIAQRRLKVVRVADELSGARTVAQVPPEELQLALVNVIRDAVVADAEHSREVVARLFGWRRNGSDIESALDNALTTLIERQEVLETSGGLRAAG